MRNYLVLINASTLLITLLAPDAHAINAQIEINVENYTGKTIKMILTHPTLNTNTI